MFGREILPLRTGPPRLELGMPGSKPGVLPITPRAKMSLEMLCILNTEEQLLLTSCQVQPLMGGSACMNRGGDKRKPNRGELLLGLGARIAAIRAPCSAKYTTCH